MIVVGQALIKADPRITWEDPFGSIRPFVEAADVAFTNFEMAVNGPGNECGVPEGYVTVLGEPRIGPEDQPGNTSWPHAVDRSEILERFRSLSARYGSEVKIRGERAFIEISGND